MACIFCGTEENLNTQMTIVLDDGRRVSVDVCDTDAETATPKLAKTQYVKKQMDISEFMKQAAALGIKFVEQNGMMVVDTSIASSKQQVKQVAAAKPPPPPTVEITEDMVPTSMIDPKTRRGMESAGGTFGTIQAPGSRSHDVAEVVHELGEELLDGHVKMTVVEARAGQKLAIPEKRVDKLGTTQINVVKGADNSEIQRRLQMMSEQSRTEQGFQAMHSFQMFGYTVRPCPLCKGRQVIKNKNVEQTCPKCKGAGDIAI